MITGQLFIRDTDGKAPGLARPHRLVIVAGILAVPLDSPLKGEHQYRVCGLTGDTLVVDLHGRDLTEEARGVTIDGLLTSPIWRA
jgi:hypothetical protein